MANNIKRYILLAAALSMTAMIVCGTPRANEGDRLRVVSLAPSSTEILFALGLDDEIVGVSRFCDNPQRAVSKERVGTFSEPNIEKIISLRPDIVFCTSLEQAPAVTKLRQLGLNVCVSDPSTIDELFMSIREIGRLVGRVQRAERLIAEMSIEVEKVRDSTRSLHAENRPKVYIEIWNSPIMAAGRGSIVDELVTIAGGVNIANDTRTPYGSFSAEEVVRRDPDVIIIAYMQRGDSLKALSERLGWGVISAVKNKRVYNDIDSDTLLRPGPRIAEGLKELNRRICQR